jgi:hypothetical protein
MKLCNKCKKIKSKSKFNKRIASLDGLQHHCRICSKKEHKKWHKENPSNSLLRNYGITIEQKQLMVNAQNNCCAICKEPFISTKNTHLDHCHDTGKIRGILCASCNHGIGKFKDSPKLLQRAVHYIEYHAKQNTTTPVSEGSYIQGAVGAELGSVSTPWTWKDYDHTDDYSGATRGENTYHSAKEGSGDGVGRGGKEVGPPQAPQSVQDHGQPEPEIVRLDFSRRHLSD